MIPSFDDQIRWGLALPFFLVAAFAQATVGPMVGLFGGHPDLVLVIAAGWAVLRSPEEAMIAGPPAAIIAGLLGAGPIGTPVLALIAPIGLALLLRSGGATPRLPSLCAAVAIGSVVTLGLDLTVQFLSGARDFIFTGLLTVTLGAALLNVLFAAAIYRPLCIGRKRKLVRRTRLSLS
jgi:cell shape-determining protein MreD